MVDESEPPQDQQPGEPRLDISAILSEYFAKEQGMEWTQDPEALNGALGDEAVTVGNLLLNTPDPLTLGVIGERSGLPSADVEKACGRLNLMITEGGPLKFVSVADHDRHVTGYQIIPTAPKQPPTEQ